MFVKDVYGKAEEASDFYLSVFKNSKRGAIARYSAGMEPDKEGAYGLSWQIVPADMETMMQDEDPERVDRVTQAVLKMKKFDLAALQKAYHGK